MKRLLFVSSLLIMFIIGPMAMADTLTLHRVTDYFSGDGGEFTLSGNDLVSFQAYYADSAEDEGNWDPSIQSFCVERNEYVSVGSTYNFDLNTAAVAGGIDGGSPDPLSVGAAYLYYQFSQGILEDYDYAEGAGRIASAADLQQAIWWLEDETAAADPNNIFINAVIGLFADPKANNNGEYPVLVLNLYNMDATFAQDMLVTASVPEPGVMHLFCSGLLGAGLFGLARQRRKLKK